MQKHYLADVIEPVVESMGFAVVRILSIGDSNPTLQVMIEHSNYKEELTVDDCAKVSRALSAKLDELDPIESKYVLEISSPGLDRPLTKIDHFKRYVNYLIKLETIEPIERRKRFKGKIMTVSPDDEIILLMDETEYKIPFANIAKAKIIITDELWSEYLKSHNANQS